MLAVAATPAAVACTSATAASDRPLRACDVAQIRAQIDLDAVPIYPKRSDAELVIRLRPSAPACRLRIGQLRLRVDDYRRKRLYAGVALAWIEEDTFDAELRPKEELAAHLALGIAWCDAGKPVTATVAGSSSFRLSQLVGCKTR